MAEMNAEPEEQEEVPNPIAIALDLFIKQIDSLADTLPSAMLAARAVRKQVTDRLMNFRKSTLSTAKRKRDIAQ
jgi:hypothetical protein